MIPKSSIASVAALVLTLGVHSTTGQEAGGKTAPEGLDMQALMEAMRLAQPGPEHEELATRAGEWTTDVSVRMAPGGPVQTQTATASSKMILGGRFLEVVSDGDFMGQPFESRSILDFDRRRGEYTIIGLDTLGTYWVTGRGKRGEDGVIRMHGEDDDPMGKQVYTFEYEILGPDENEYRVVFHRIGETVYEDGFTMVSVRSKRKLE